MKDLPLTEEQREQAKKDFEPIKQSLLKEIEEGKKHGFDVHQHWKDMLNSLEEDKTLY